ncbi:unnamed protein product [Psylliodes chrysocephalus]|uniref:Phorbol-ester/DAG-type domain-containing protein n=1 Tax=Psylliodes chrysocephalus TaxID=3402493 RepID=A0A9P0DB79_9CUCU|nr:unnamed protein product [Psylliodes chrysocephala]
MGETNTNVTDDNSCKRCSQTVKTGIRCIRCGKLSHKSCLEKLKIDVNRKDGLICCGASNVITVSENLTPTETSLSASQGNDAALKVGYLERIILDKQKIIDNQEIAIKALTEQVELLKEVMSANNAPQITKLGPQKSVSLNKNGDNNIDPGSSPSSNEITYSAVAQDHLSRAHGICNSIIHLNNDIPRKQTLMDTTKNIPPVPRRPAAQSYNQNIRKTSSLLIGTKASSECTLKAANRIHSPTDRIFDYHATNFDIDTNHEELQGYLAGFAPKVKVERLSARFPEMIDRVGYSGGLSLLNGSFYTSSALDCD